MKTLYDLLDIERNAAHADIERGYRRCLDAYLANKGTGQPDRETLQMQAIREAYLLLSSPARRKAYDEKLRESAETRYARAAAGGLPRASLMLAIALLVGGSSYLYKAKAQPDKMRIAPRAEQADAHAARPANQALAAELSRQEKDRLEQARRAADTRRREIGQARSDAQRWNLQNQQIAGTD